MREWLKRYWPVLGLVALGGATVGVVAVMSRRHPVGPATTLGGSGRTCPEGTVRIGRRFALRLLDWHGGQNSPTYAVGSSGFADRCVPKPLVFKAARELRSIRGMSSSTRERAQLQRLADVLRRKALPYEGSE